MKRFGSLLGLTVATLVWLTGANAATAPDPLTAQIDIANNALWTKPQAPLRVFGNTWLVGTANLTVALIDTGDGLIVIDAGPPQMAPMVIANIKAAGFSPSDIRYVLVSEPHYDHAGGLAAIHRATGARVLASAPAAKVLRAGHSGPDDPQLRAIFPYPPVRDVRPVADGHHIRLGATMVTAHAMPGHTPGSMGWSWRSCEGDRCADLVFAPSMSARTDGHYRYSAPEQRGTVARFRKSLATLAALPCDGVITGHPAHSDGEAKYARQQADPSSRAYLVPGACQAMAEHYSLALDQQLKEESTAR